MSAHDAAAVCRYIMRRPYVCRLCSVRICERRIARGHGLCLRRCRTVALLMLILCFHFWRAFPDGDARHGHYAD